MVSNDELRHYILTGETRALSTAVGSDGSYTVSVRLAARYSVQVFSPAISSKGIMLKHELIKNVLVTAIQNQGYGLNGRDQLIIRTSISSTLAAQRCRADRERSASVSYIWRKPLPCRK